MRYIPLILILLFSISSQTQTLEAGIKAGVNYNFSGDLSEIISDTEDIIHQAKTIEGYHGGLWAQLNVTDDLFLRPAIQYTQFQNNYTSESSPTYTLKTKKIDLPVIIGAKIVGPLYIFGGPDFQYILDEDFTISDSESNSDMSYKDFTTGLHVGIGADFGRIGLELCWDKGLSQQTLDIFNSDLLNDFTLDNRPNQLLLSVQVALTSID